MLKIVQMICDCGGERQIVSICGAIVQDTDLIILDEPTSALDIKNQNKVLSLIKKIAKEQGKTFILYLIGYNLLQFNKNQPERV